MPTNNSLMTVSFFSLVFPSLSHFESRSQWPRGLRHELSLTRSNTGVIGSNPTQGMDVYVRLFSDCVVFCVGIGLATG
jgi:hypothetical protein